MLSPHQPASHPPGADRLRFIDARPNDWI